MGLQLGRGVEDRQDIALAVIGEELADCFVGMGGDAKEEVP